MDILRSPERLAVLRDLEILDTPAEPAYDDLAALAAAACASRIAAVNFVEADRHWTKAMVGVEGGQGASVTNDLSFCAATVSTPDGVLSVADTTQDPRWRDHPFVTGPPHLRYYAGAAIQVAGRPVGVVCVFGAEEREVGRREEDALVALARQAAAQLELRRRNAELRDLTLHDSLTGLANRTLLADRLQLALAQSAREGGHVAVLFCDVDAFKAVNDRAGHEAGDRLLCSVASRLRSACRSTDTAARFAGDEFVLLCPGLEQASELGSVLDRVHHALRAPELRDDDGYAVTVSVGGALAEPGDSGADVLRRADRTMYLAKQSRSPSLTALTEILAAGS